MKQPPSIQPVSTPGPDYDPMDRIVENLLNIESFVTKVASNPRDKNYLNKHLSQILALRRTISQQLDLLAEDPYHYDHDRLKKLHHENEQIFSSIEGAVGSMDPWDKEEFHKFIKATEKNLSQFDDDLTPG